jgi:hypothetical protein
LWQSHVAALLSDLASLRDPVSIIQIDRLAVLVGAPLVLGRMIRNLLIAAALAERASRITRVSRHRE